jgi:hypothetical protein
VLTRVGVWMLNSGAHAGHRCPVRAIAGDVVRVGSTSAVASAGLVVVLAGDGW